jgi:7-keto-8-aminopelargonate synthetase-like enzyme
MHRSISRKGFLTAVALLVAMNTATDVVVYRIDNHLSASGIRRDIEICTALASAGHNPVVDRLRAQITADDHHAAKACSHVVVIPR